MRATDESGRLITHEFSKISFFIFFRQCWCHRHWASLLPAIPVHSALLLVLAFFTSAGLWLLLEAEFLAITLVLVYVGAVMVLFLFVVMMLDINLDQLA